VLPCEVVVKREVGGEREAAAPQAEGGWWGQVPCPHRPRPKLQAQDWPGLVLVVALALTLVLVLVVELVLVLVRAVGEVPIGGVVIGGGRRMAWIP